VNAKICPSEEKRNKMTSSPYFKTMKLFNENMSMVEKYKKEVILDKPIYIGFSVLDLSKLLMYKFHYGFMMRKYGPDKAKLLFTDTDSLTYRVETDDIYKDMTENREMFDFSDYPSEKDESGNDVVIMRDAEGKETFRIHNKDENKKVIGIFKEELLSLPVTHFCGHRSKMYALKIEIPDRLKEFAIKNKIKTEKKTAKGISQHVKNKKMFFDDYLKPLEDENNVQSIIQNSFKIEKHKIYSIEQQKKSLSAFDDKKYILDDGITTLAYGHYKINK
jgi:hypothetical protein